MCGIVGVVSKGDVNQSLYDALLVLQHRGQDAAGIMTSEEGHLHLRKSNGLVRDVFHERHMLKLTGNMGIAHTRYPTAGNPHSSESQPFYTNSPYGIGLAHNGNLTNARALRELLLKEDLRHLNTDSDSEVLLNVFAHELQRVGGVEPDERAIFKAVSAVHRRCRGAYAVTVLVAGFGVVGFRDPNGIRPLVYGTRETEQGTEYMLASESVALDVCGFQLVRDVAPGEAVAIHKDGKIFTHQCADKPVFSPCIFEYVYFARPDSTMDDVSVHKARMRMGEKLAEKIQREWPDHDIDVVIPIPDTSRTSALQLANMLGVKFREGFIKNRYIGRTFIMPGQKQRNQSVRQKLNAIDLEFHGKNVLLVDDSIVRGTTSRQIVQMARDVGANKVYFASAAPPVKYPNVYGIDMPSGKELIAHGKSEAEVAEFIGADKLIYQDLNDLIEAVRRGNPRIQRFDTSVFTGEYVTGDVTPDYLASLEQERSDEAKQKRSLSERIAKIS
ncbi:MAG TPA: amidophosphoribosyltransferase [Gammaproteobacteria bacterium]|jgi:amidophosphoribosyltransferase|nr:amidophosphoribosyltransferase [Gammaproteobacteria bacterium]